MWKNHPPRISFKPGAKAKAAGEAVRSVPRQGGRSVPRQGGAGKGFISHALTLRQRLKRHSAIPQHYNPHPLEMIHTVQP